MIAYFLGIPGSGKTYYGVNVIYDNFAKHISKKSKLSLKKDYQNCYTNINEFNYDLVHDVHHFDFDDFYEKIKILYCMYQGISSSDLDDNSSYDNSSVSLENLDFRNLSMAEIKALRQSESENIEKPKKSKKLKKASDAELIEKAKELNIYKTLFVVDECHNFLDTQDKVKVWWLTYHRHLYHDIYLITQSLSLVNVKYKPLAEAFYKAKSSSLTLNKNYFNYMYFTESRMSKESFVETKKILKNQNVFKLYKSGDIVESKNVILKFIKIAIVLFIVLVVMGYFFYHEQMSSVSDFKKEQLSVVESSSDLNDSTKLVVDNNINDVSSLIYLRLNCTVSMCSYDKYYFDINLLKFAKKHFDLQVINSVDLFNSVYLSVVVDSSFLNFLQGGQNDKNNEDIIDVSDSINPFKSK